ncbi:lactate utilization protein [Fusibacter bizertensis]
MDQHLKKVTESRIKRTILNLAKNNMNGYHVANTKELKNLLANLVPENASVAVGGSMTLFETGIIDWIREQPYHFFDRYAEGITPAELKQVHRNAFSANAYFCSSNAITERGELYNVDGSGNRVAAISYGPDKVFIILSANKIVKNIEEAVTRNREISAPANNVRLNTGTPCTFTGSCSDCRSEGRICCSYSIIAHQRDKDRIHVIFIDGQYGY